jgi:hypothetical protein
MENLKIITVYHLEDLHFGPKWFLKKTALKKLAGFSFLIRKYTSEIFYQKAHSLLWVFESLNFKHSPPLVLMNTSK